ncbi:MAG: RNA polymerase sigma factor [Candidatus Aminicenantaceae bacterium]
MWMKSEDEMVEAVLGGDKQYFELLLHPYRQGILNMAYRVTGNLEEAKEICQEAFIKIYRYLGKFKKGKSFKSWIYKITMNSTYDFLRKKKRHEDLLEYHKSSLVNAVRDPEDLFSKKEMKLKVESLLKILSPKERMIFLLRDGEGFSIKETSDALGCSSISVRTHLSQARRKIRERFEEVYRGRR